MRLSSRPRSVLRKWITRFAVALVLLLPLMFACVWLAVQHVPDWYVPPAIAPEDYQLVRNDFEAVFNEISENLMGSESFTLVLKDEQVNNWMAARGQILPEAERWLPPDIKDPMVRFDNNTLTVAGTAARGRIQSVVSLSWQFDIKPDTIVARLQGTRTGALPVPDDLIRRGLEKITEDSASPKVPVFGNDMDLEGRIRQAGTGLEIENRFRWKNGDRLFRIIGLESRGGVVRFQIEPLDRR